MDKKAQGLSLNTIIVAIVVLIVLVVLIMVFTGYFGTRFTPEVTSCANAGGKCEYENDNCGTDVFGEAVRKLLASCPPLTEGGESGICCSRGIGTGTPPPIPTTEGTTEETTEEGAAEVECGEQGQPCCGIGTDSMTCTAGACPDAPTLPICP